MDLSFGYFALEKQFDETVRMRRVRMFMSVVVCNLV
jgi:hypothetical protein